jgi:hypothetical protein
MRRKRAPGGGRKPKGAVPMRSQVNVRMPDDLRAQLEAAARKRGRNVSEELLARLRVSFAREREQRRDPAMRALTFLISHLADRVNLSRSPKWHENAFLFDSFRLAVSKLLEKFKSDGETRSPYENEASKLIELCREKLPATEEVVRLFLDERKTPEAAAEVVVRETLGQLFGWVPASLMLGELMGEARTSTDTHTAMHTVLKDVEDELDRIDYGMSDVRRDLDIRFRPKKGANNGKHSQA